MARLLTSGFEMNRVGTVNTEPDGLFTGATVTSGTVRSGAFALSCASGAGNIAAFVDFAVTFAASTTYYMRGYMNFSQFPATTKVVMDFAAGVVAIQVTSTGTLQLTGAAQIGSDSAALSLGTWYRVEASMVLDGSLNITSATASIDGTQFASGATSGIVSTNIVQYGWLVAPGANLTMFVDDIAVNNNSGASQNNLPGSGSVVLLKPTADSAGGTGWRLGTNTALGGNGFASVDNEPPNGVADLQAGSDPKQIRNATSNANDSFDATMTTYTAAGVGTGATVNVVDPIIATAAPVSTGAKQGTVGVVSNPAIANIALAAGGTSGAFWSGTAAGTYVTGWKWSHGTVTYAPSVTLGTAPVMRITQVTSSTRIAMVCFMGMYVDYTPAVGGLAPAERVALQAVTRSTVW